ncbi:MAG: proton-translocating NADH-quinone oxidoreductase, chain [Chloroflexi bacterium]|nr:proton-translocating NADH-quinone oxidoreductase, chain [Chloroflexota bacterium]
MDLVLNLAIWLPLAAAVPIAVLPGNGRRPRWIALAASGAVLLLSLVLAVNFQRAGVAGLQFGTHIPWIDLMGVSYSVGLDGLSLPMFLLNSLLVFLAVLISWNESRRTREYFALVLVLETAVAGVFAAQDFLLFFLFWELELAPMFLLIGIWGGARREYAAMKFILYTVAGSAFMLLGILMLYFAAPAPRSFSMLYLAAQQYAPAVQSLAWLLLFLGFAVKVPIFPFHTWLPDAHTEAPTAISVLLAGVLLKMGAYGLLRVNVGMLPEATQQAASTLAALAVINIVYGAFVAMMQTDLKRVIANSSISHMGYAVLGAAALTPAGIEGAVFQMFTHGTITGLLFMMVGLVYDRTHTRDIRVLGGLARRMPFIAVVFIIAGLASLGLPGLSGFVSEFLIFVGAFPVWQPATILAIATIVLTAGYILWLIERVFFGPERPDWQGLRDASRLEAVTVSLLVLVIVLVGVLPSVLADIVIPGVAPLAARYSG